MARDWIIVGCCLFAGFALGWGAHTRPHPVAVPRVTPTTAAVQPLGGVPCGAARTDAATARRLHCLP